MGNQYSPPHLQYERLCDGTGEQEARFKTAGITAIRLPLPGEGHAELRPQARPPHTLSPAAATRAGRPAAVFGTMGGDGQPQILLQVAARLFLHQQSPAQAIHAGRWVLRGPVTGFDTWTSPSGQVLQVEGHAPADWAEALTARGHAVQPVAPYDSAFGHAHAIIRDEEGCWAGAADPRARVASAAGG